MPDISKISLPSGTIYDIKDTTAREMISAGVKFIVAWDGASSPVAANIPAGVVVTYNSTDTTGSLAVTTATPGSFYLVKSKTSPTSESLDMYDEYVVIKPDTEDNTTWYWEKIGDTKLNLTDVVTGVSFNKSTSTVIGSDATFTITQPTIAIGSYGATATGRVQTAIGSGTASLSNTDWLKGVSVSNETLTIGAATLDTTYLGATASGANTAWNNKDSVTALNNSTSVSVTKGQ